MDYKPVTKESLREILEEVDKELRDKMIKGELERYKGIAMKVLEVRPAGDVMPDLPVKNIDPGFMSDGEYWDGQWGNRTAHIEGCTNVILDLTFREKIRTRFVLYAARAVVRIKKLFKRG